MKVKNYILNSVDYKVDSTYQRPAGIWSLKDKQCLIDTILRKEPIPLIFLNYITKEKKYFIVDGQQRLSCILDFYNNKFALSKEFSDECLDHKKFNDLTLEMRDRFLNYTLDVKQIEDYDDERIRMIFSRLQRGRPLGFGEKLNAKPGEIVVAMRELAKHEFMTKSIGINKQRYHAYEDIARFMFYEKFNVKQCNIDCINEMFEKYKNDITINSDIYKKVQNVLNFLLKCFPAEPGDYQFLSKRAWIYTVYTVISDLKESYALNGHEEEIHNFVESFHSKVLNEDWRRSNNLLLDFYDCVRGGWSEKLNTSRRNIMKDFMVKKLKLKRLDIKRQITDEEKVTAYGRANGRCEKCGYKFKDYKEAEYHHVEFFINSGISKVCNIMALCQKCHAEIHRTKPLNTNIELKDLKNEE